MVLEDPGQPVGDVGRQRNAATVSQGTTFGELVASLRQINGQRGKGKHIY
jgi:hypothetical protein